MTPNEKHRFAQRTKAALPRYHLGSDPPSPGRCAPPTGKGQPSSRYRREPDHLHEREPDPPSGSAISSGENFPRPRPEEAYSHGPLLSQRDQMRYSLRRCQYVSSAKFSVAGSYSAKQSGGTPSKPGWTRWIRTGARTLVGIPIASACPPPDLFPCTSRRASLLARSIAQLRQGVPESLRAAQRSVIQLEPRVRPHALAQASRFVEEQRGGYRDVERVRPSVEGNSHGGRRGGPPERIRPFALIA